METKRKLRPVLKSDWWLIGPSPDLKGILPGAEEWEKKDNSKYKNEHNAPVDHHMFQDPKGIWHLWGCLRQTAVGRVFYHWKTDDITKSPWECTGEIIRRDPEYGESFGSSPGEGENEGNDAECMQSPYFIKIDDTFYMFYGAGRANPTEEEIQQGYDLPEAGDVQGSQMCLMTSKDGINWTRYKNKDGNSRLFIGPGPTRDPVLIKIEDLWHIYYAGTKNNDLDQPVFWARTSPDLYEWSNPIMIHDDLSFGKLRWDTECPVVVYKEGYYYLFRTEDYYLARTHVFRSEDPLDFGVGDASDKYVGIFPAGAPELYEIDGKEYVSSNHDPITGTMMAEMTWIED